MKNIRSIAACIVLAIAAAGISSSPALSAPITVPTDLSVGDTYRLAFVTSANRNATSTDIADYNTFVTNVANAVPELAALGTTWTAIASTATVAARDNTSTLPSFAGGSIGSPIYRLDDERIADSNDQLWNTGGFPFHAPLAVTEQGSLLGGAPLVWTGTIGDGQIATNSSFLGAPDQALVGVATSTNFGWVRATLDITRDLTTHPLYGISGVLTVGPEPSTVSLLASGLVALAAARRRRAL